MVLSTILNPKFQAAINKLSTQDVPLKVAIDLKNNIELIVNTIEFYEIYRKEMLTKYGKKDDTGEFEKEENGSVKFEQENAVKFASEMQDKLNESVDVRKINLTDFSDNCKLSVDDLFILQDFLE